MIKLRLTGLAILLASGTMAPLVAAQTATGPQPISPPPAPPPKVASSAPSLSPKTMSALKLAGLVTFVANSCPALKPNYHRFQAAINALGVTEADLNTSDMRGRYLGYTARYNADVKTSCERAEADFGPRGIMLHDIFERQRADILPPQ